MQILIENVDPLWFNEFFSVFLEIIIFTPETEIRKWNPTLTGVTKGVVSGVASIAASGGDSKLNLLAWPMVRLGWLGCSVFELTLGVRR